MKLKCAPDLCTGLARNLNNLQLHAIQVNSLSKLRNFKPQLTDACSLQKPKNSNLCHCEWQTYCWLRRWWFYFALPSFKLQLTSSIILSCNLTHFLFDSHNTALQKHSRWNKAKHQRNWHDRQIGPLQPVKPRQGSKEREGFKFTYLCLRGQLKKVLVVVYHIRHGWQAAPEAL